MKESTRNILKGIGNILDIMPSPSTSDYSRFIPKGTAEDRMRETWERVGGSIKWAMGQYSNEFKASKKDL